MPRWEAFGDTSLYAFGVDAAARHNGAAVLRIEPVRTPPPARRDPRPIGYAAWRLDGVRYRGKRVRVHGEMKTAGAGSAALSIEAARARPHAERQRVESALHGDSDWRPVEATLDVPGDALQLELGAKLEGPGTLWTKYPRVDVVGPAERSLAAARMSGALDAARRATVERALRHDAGALRTVDPAGPLDDLAGFDRDVAHARIVGLGQATDGSVEAFRMKQRLFRDLVERHGVTVLVFEAALPEARALDRYVTGRDGDPVRALAGLRYWTWQQREIADLLRWMQAYNRARRAHPLLHVAGYEAPFGDVAMRNVARFAAARSKAASAAVADGYACIPKSSAEYFAFFSAGREARPACIARVAGVARAIAPLHPDMDTAHDARVVEQYVQNELDPRGNGFGADDRLLENIVWLAQTRYPGAKLALWTHNNVLSPAPRTHWGESLGSQLHRRYASGFVRIGFRLYDGAITGSAIDAVRTITIAPAPPDTLESVLDRVGPRLYLSLRALATGDPVAAWLDRSTVSREFSGLIPGESGAGAAFSAVKERERFDALVFIAHSHPSSLLARWRAPYPHATPPPSWSTAHREP